MQALTTLVNNMIVQLQSFAIPLAILILVIGGIIYLTAAGDARQAAVGKSAIIGALVGLIIVLAAGSIAGMVSNAMPAQPLPVVLPQWGGLVR